MFLVSGFLEIFSSKTAWPNEPGKKHLWKVFIIPPEKHGCQGQFLFLIGLKFIKKCSTMRIGTMNCYCIGCSAQFFVFRDDGTTMADIILCCSCLWLTNLKTKSSLKSFGQIYCKVYGMSCIIFLKSKWQVCSICSVHWASCCMTYFP